MNTLTGKIVKLRAMEPSDLDVLYEWENYPDNWQIGNTISPFSKHILLKYIENAHQDIYEARQLRLMIDQLNPGGKTPGIVGTIDLFEFDPQHQRAGIGILIGNKKDRTRGLASEAISLLLEYAFNVLHLHQVFCNVSTDNKASLNLFKKFGFREVGVKLDWIKIRHQWVDVCLLQKINPADT